MEFYSTRGNGEENFDYCLMNLQLRNFRGFWMHVKCWKCVWCPTHPVTLPSVHPVVLCGACAAAVLVSSVCCTEPSVLNQLLTARELCWSFCRSSWVGNRCILVGELFVSNTWVLSQLHSEWGPVEFTRSEEAEAGRSRCGWIFMLV